MVITGKDWNPRSAAKQEIWAGKYRPNDVAFIYKPLCLATASKCTFPS